MEGEYVEGIRRSRRLESNDEMKIADKATTRAMAKDTFINKGTSSNPFSVLNTDNVVLMDVAQKLGVDIGSSYNEAESHLEGVNRRNLKIKILSPN
jgi:hypothetical protein